MKEDILEQLLLFFIVVLLIVVVVTVPTVFLLQNLEGF